VEREEIEAAMAENCSLARDTVAMRGMLASIVENKISRIDKMRGEY